MKKGQGLSLNTIIIAAIVLIVLIVLWAIFTGRMGVFSKSVKEETAKQPCPEGYSAKLAQECEPEDTLLGNYDVPTGQVCCKTTPITPSAEEGD